MTNANWLSSMLVCQSCSGGPNGRVSASTPESTGISVLLLVSTYWHIVCFLVKQSFEVKQEETKANKSSQQDSREDQMAHVVQFVPAIASVVALLIVSPRQAYRSAISALTDYATHSGHPFSIMLRVREKQTSPINVVI
jgi:hypothetical protein